MPDAIPLRSAGTTLTAALSMTPKARPMPTPASSSAAYSPVRDDSGSVNVISNSATASTAYSTASSIRTDSNRTSVPVNSGRMKTGSVSGSSIAPDIVDPAPPAPWK